MFIIKVKGNWGECFVNAEHDPCFEKENALLFKTRQEAGDYISQHFNEWENVTDGSSTMTVQEA